jgi:hypothetical protein
MVTDGRHHRTYLFETRIVTPYFLLINCGFHFGQSVGILHCMQGSVRCRAGLDSASPQGSGVREKCPSIDEASVSESGCDAGSLF